MEAFLAIMSRHFSVAAKALLAILLSGGFSPFSQATDSPAVAVLYPNLQEPYRSVVASIIEGIRSELKAPMKLIPLGGGDADVELKALIDHEEISTIIALGRTGLVTAEKWQNKIPIVAGAMLLAPDKDENGIAGISLAGDPGIFFSYLNQVAPTVKRVHVVYNAKSSGWLVQAAHSLATKQKFKLISYESEDIKGSALIYRDILNKSQPGQDAIWLLPDPVAVDSRIILPLLLKSAWDQDVLVFSSNPAHVRRGVLFALFPDNELMGRSLGKMAQSYLGVNGEDVINKVLPLRDLQAAINVRTAEHIGLSVSAEQMRKFSLVFPAQ